MSAFKSFIILLKRLLGFPQPANGEQKEEKLITMREARDCLVAAIATLCKITYEQAYKAIWHWNLPWILESPLLSNPLNAERALKSLGFEINNKITPEDIEAGKCQPGKVLVLVHMPVKKFFGLWATLNQHWVVWMGKNEKGEHLFHWGQKQELKALSFSSFRDHYYLGWPNCAISINEKESSQ